MQDENSGGDPVSKGKVAIIGIGEVPTRNMPERTHWDIIYDTCMEAIKIGRASCRERVFITV